MRFEPRTFWLAKDSDYPDEYQDAFALDAERGVAAVADGVADCVFSASWAQILARAVVARPAILADPDEFHGWLTEQRAAWCGGIDFSNIPWFVKPKMVDGAMTTLLWIELTPFNGKDQGGNDIDGNDNLPHSYLLRSFAIGDCCLFHLRGDEQLCSFPIDNSEAFGLYPQVIGSVDRNQNALADFHVCEYECLPGDLLVLTSDALAQWAVNRSEAGETVDWGRFWEMSYELWREEVLALRREQLIRYDDTTLLLLRVVDETATPNVAPDSDKVLTEFEETETETCEEENGPIVAEVVEELLEEELPQMRGEQSSMPAEQEASAEVAEQAPSVLSDASTTEDEMDMERTNQPTTEDTRS